MPGNLEMHYNNTFLSSVDKAIRWAETITWNGTHPAVHLIDKVYQNGAKLTKEAMKICENGIKRLGNLPKWYVTIESCVWVNYLLWDGLRLKIKLLRHYVISLQCFICYPAPY